MKTLKLADRLALGFGVLISLVFLLGGMAILEMRKVGRSSDGVSRKDVPMVKASVASRRALTQAWYEIRLYCSTEEDGWRVKAEDHLAAAQSHLREASDLANRYSQLVGLNTNLADADKQAKALEVLFKRIISRQKEIQTLRVKQDACGAQFIDSCLILLNNQMRLLDTLTLEGTAATNLVKTTAEIRVLFSKVSLIGELLNAGNLLRVTNWKAQALHDQDNGESVKSRFESITTKCDELTLLVSQSSNKDQLAAIILAANEYKQAMSERAAAGAALVETQAEIVSVAKKGLSAVDLIATTCIVRVTETAAQSSAELTRATGVMLVGLLISIVLGGLIATSLFRGITKPVLKGVAFVNALVKGDFSQRLVVEQNDEIGRLAQALNAVAGNLQAQITEMREAANVLASSASEISASVTQVTSGAQETATAVTQTTATIEEVKQSAHLTSQKSTGVAENAQRGLQTAYAAKKATETAVEGMARMNEQMVSIADTTMKLGEQSQAIGEITSTVDDIAEQSNLLAVNAAVEAAKAGEYGKGFAVVAQEIKTLAEQSKQATKQVRSILNDIQKATGAAVLATEQGSKAVDQGAKEAMNANESIQTLSACFTDTVQSAGQIAASMQELLTGMDQVALAMGCIRDASHQNVVSMKQLESAAQTLKDIGAKFTRLVERYKV